MVTSKSPQIGVRVDPAFRAEIKLMADKHFDRSESALLREAARTYISLRRKLGPQYEPTIAILTGETSEPRETAIAS